MKQIQTIVSGYKKSKQCVKQKFLLGNSDVDALFMSK